MLDVYKIDMFKRISVFKENHMKYIAYFFIVVKIVLRGTFKQLKFT